MFDFIVTDGMNGNTSPIEYEKLAKEIREFVKMIDPLNDISVNSYIINRNRHPNQAGFKVYLSSEEAAVLFKLRYSDQIV